MMKDMKCSSLSCVSPWLPRVGLGLALVGFGVAHYRFFGGDTGFHAMAMQPLQNVSLLAMLAGLLAYIVPALQIVGGALFATKQLCYISKFCILAALGGILGWAGLAMIVGGPEAAGGAGQAINGAIIFLLGYSLVKKMECCSSTCSPGGSACGSNSNCGDKKM